MIGQRPVIMLGHGATCAQSLLPELMDLGVPVLTTWQAIDLVDNFHPAYFGRTGIYGQRCANKVLYNSGHVIAIGARMSRWTTGYGDYAPVAKMTVCDIDEGELHRFPFAEQVCMNARQFVAELCAKKVPEMYDWRRQCDSWRKEFPWLEPIHQSKDYINSHDFAFRLMGHMRQDEIVVTDAGSACTGPFQVMAFRPPQRLMTSGGLGEMGCAIPAAIGAAIASNKRVLCFVGDGAAMLNLQELQTIRHRNLPIKIFVFANDGYAMIRGTQRNTLEGRYVAVNAATGVSCPNFERVAQAFNIPAMTAHTPYDMELVFQGMQADGPFLAQIMLDPEQVYGPKLQPVRREDGTIENAVFERMSP